MSIEKAKLISVLSTSIPLDVINPMLDEYLNIKQQFLLRKFQPTELNGARFCECALRLLEHLHAGIYTPFDKSLHSESIIRTIENNTSQPDTIRFFVPRLIRVILDVRNKRDVAHVGGEVNPNFSDSLLVLHAADWILTELVRHFHNCPVDEAQQIVQNINESKIPIVTEVDGFIRIQNIKLETRKKVLVILYYKRPTKVTDTDLCKWLRYSNSSQFRNKILKELDSEALVHYENGNCVLLEKGVVYVEKFIPLNLFS